MTLISKACGWMPNLYSVIQNPHFISYYNKSSKMIKISSVRVSGIILTFMTIHSDKTATQRLSPLQISVGWSLRLATVTKQVASWMQRLRSCDVSLIRYISKIYCLLSSQEINFDFVDLIMTAYIQRQNFCKFLTWCQTSRNLSILNSGATLLIV